MKQIEDLIEPYSATIPRKDPAALIQKPIDDSIFTYRFQHKGWHSPQKVNLQKSHLCYNS